MNPILILRCEIICAIIMIFLFAYSMLYSKEKSRKFQITCIIGFLHLIFDGITVYTVNHTEIVSSTFNFILHFFMYAFAFLFAFTIFSYVVDVIKPGKFLKRFRNIMRIPFILYLIMMPFTEIEYIQGNGTKYSMGLGAIIGFGFAIVYLTLGSILILANIRRIEKGIVFALLSMNIIWAIVIIVQVIVPELLFTGALVTIATIGLFFAIENPAAHFMKRAYIDMGTGVKNKNCYKDELKFLEEKSQKKPFETAFVVCDLNGLKLVNDNFGHFEGDELIRAAADVLSSELNSAYGVYRVGGDEFTAVYIGSDISVVSKEIESARAACAQYSGLKCPLSIAIGYAISSDENIIVADELIKIAEKRMYEDKKRIKAENPLLVRA